MKNDLIIFAPKYVCVEKVRLLEMGIEEKKLLEEKVIGYASYSPVLDRRVSLNYTDIDYVYKKSDFTNYCNPEFIVHTSAKGYFDWIDNPRYTNV